MDKIELEENLAQSIGAKGKTEENVNQIPSVSVLLFIIRGLYGIFWGMLFVVLSTAHLCLVKPRQFFAESVCGLAIIALLYGSWLLFRTRSLNPKWNHRVRHVFVCGALTVYFSLFFFLWLRLPQSSYMQVNAIGYGGSLLIFSAIMSRAVSSLVAMLSEHQLERETKIVTTSSWGIILLPLILGLSYILRGSIAHDHGVLDELFNMLRDPNWLTLSIVLLPFAQMLSVVWIAKDAVIDQVCLRDRAVATSDSSLAKN